MYSKKDLKIFYDISKKGGTFSDSFNEFNISKECNIIRLKNKELTALRVTILDYFNILSVKMFFNKRNKNMSHPRALFYYISTKYLNFKNSEVSSFLGVDPSAVSYGKNKIISSISIGDEVTINDIVNIRTTLVSKNIINLDTIKNKTI